MFDFSIFRTRRQRTPKELRWGGALTVVLGLIVGTVGAVCAWLLVDFPGDGPSDLQRAGIAAVAFAFLVFGAASIVQGTLQLVRARRSQTLMRIMVVIAVLFAIADVIASLL